MAGGANYCVVSHLPIEGEDCMLFPLAFNFNVNPHWCNSLNIDHYIGLFSYIDEPIKVFYDDRYFEVEYPEGHRYNHTKHEFYMLVHLGFYEKIMSELDDYYGINKINSLHHTKQLRPIYDIAKEIYDKAFLNFAMDNKLDKKSPEFQEKMNEVYDMDAPLWIKDLFKFAHFMDNLGIKPYPNYQFKQTQEDFDLYNKVRNSFLKT